MNASGSRGEMGTPARGLFSLEKGFHSHIFVHVVAIPAPSRRFCCDIDAVFPIEGIKFGNVPAETSQRAFRQPRAIGHGEVNGLPGVDMSGVDMDGTDVGAITALVHQPMVIAAQGDQVVH